MPSFSITLASCAPEGSRIEEAIEYFERSMRLRPNYTDAHLNLGRL